MTKLNYNKITKRPRINSDYHCNPNIREAANVNIDDSIIHFGVHKGKSWSSTPSSYLYWLVARTIDLDTKSLVMKEIIARKEIIWTTCQQGKKYKGISWNEIPDSYLQWMLKQQFSSSVKNIVKFKLSRR